ncbi:hypothetical protein PybrP1_011831, partial [[Pythium] brassicae (nom. inval.)]
MERAAKVEPFTLLELTLRHSLVAVLSKPRWWCKWRDAEIRCKWLDEIVRELVQQTLTQSRRWEPSDDEILRGLVEAIGADEQDALLATWFQCVRNDPWEKWPPSEDTTGAGGDAETRAGGSKGGGGDRDEGASNDNSSGKSEDEDEFQEKRMNAYVYIEWYFTRVVLREKSVPASADAPWDVGKLRDEIRAAETRSDPTVVPRALAFILSVVDSGATEASVQAALQGVETRPKTLAELRKRCEAIGQELANARLYVSKVLDQIAAADQQMLFSVDPAGDHSGSCNDGATDCEPTTLASPAGVHGVWICDDLVPTTVKAALVRQVAALEDVPEHTKDWHPNTDQQVLDLVHPSLYCCVLGVTKQVVPPVDPERCSDAAEHMRKIAGGGSALVTSPFQGRPDSSSRNKSGFQWIPSEFRVADDGSVRILSYINNVHPERHRELYGAIETIFARFVPLFERSLSAVAEGVPGPVFRWPQDYNEDRPQFPKKVEIPFSKGSSVVSLRGQRLQVIVKIAEIVLTPEAPTYSGGSWHIEGTETEQIVATGIYYFGCDNIRDSRLAFRVSVLEPMYEQSDDSGVAVMFGLFNDDRLVQPLGSVSTIEDQCLVFPNIVQHKVEPFELEDRAKPGVRKILAFFLVDPEKPIPSTAAIPPQQQEWVDEIQRPLLQKIKLVESLHET